MNIPNLTEAASAVRKNAHAPYSGFKVGAALRTDDGQVFAGCNVENASYSMCICAERNAVFQAVAAGKTDFRSLAIVGGRDSEEAASKPCIPCGACLQVLSEFCSPDFPILLTDGVHRLSEFLPNTFTLEK